MAVPGLGIPLAGRTFAGRTEREGFLRAGVYASEAVLAIAGEGYALVREGEVLVGADVGAGHALDAAVFPQLEETVGRHREMLILHPLEHILVEKAHLGRSDEVLVRAHLFEDGGQILVRVLVDGHLLVHVKDGQIVVHHQDGPDIVHLDALALAKFIPVLGHVHAGVAESDDGEHVRCLEGGLLHELADDLGNGAGIVRADDTDFIGLISQVFLFKFLRNADRAVGELAGDEQGIAGGGEIEDQALLVLGAVLQDGGMGTGSDACHGDGGQGRSHQFQGFSSVHFVKD